MNSKKTSELEAYIFETITTNWNGSSMLFPTLTPRGYRNVEIRGHDIMQVIKDSIKRANEL